MPSKANKRLQHEAKKAAEAAAAKENAAKATVATGDSDQPGPSSQVQNPEASPAAAAPPVVPTDGSASSQPGPSNTKTGQKVKVPEVPLALPTALKPLSEMPFGKHFDVKTNSFVVEIKDKQIYRYNVRIERSQKPKVWKNANGSDGKKEYTTKDVAASAGGSRRRQAAFLKIVRNALTALGKKDHIIAYDGGKTLYTPYQLEKLDSVDFDSVKLSNDLRKEFFDTSIGALEVSFEEQSVMETSDLHKETLVEMVSGSKDVTAMVQVALTQKAREEGFQIAETGRQVYVEATDLPGEPGIEMRYGLAASVRIAEGRDKLIGQPQMLLSLKTSYFFKPVSPAHLKVFHNYTPKQFARVDKYMRGIRVKVIYGSLTFEIAGISKIPLGQLRTPEGKELHKQAEARLRQVVPNADVKCNLDLPAVYHMRKNNETKVNEPFYYPMEYLIMTGDQKLMQRHGLVPKPMKCEERFAKTTELAQRIKLFGENNVLRAFGITISRNPIVCKAYSVPKPVISHRGSISTPNEKVKWNEGRFCHTTDINKILILFNSTESGIVAKEGGEKKSSILTNAQDLQRKLVKHAEGMGMKKPDVKIVDIACFNPTTHEMSSDAKACTAIRRKMAAMKSSRETPYCFYIDSSTLKTHNTVKLQERLHGITIQQACPDKWEKEGLGPVTAKNLLAKVNTKVGGMNHEVKVDDSIKHLFGNQSNTLILSYDVCHASGEKVYKKGDKNNEPSCVGFGYNTLHNKQAIVGDFHLQLGSEEVQEDILQKKAKEILNDYNASHSVKMPSQVIILRDGVSEGQFQMVIRELKTIKKAMTATMKGPKFALLVVTKRHGHRLYLDANKANNSVNNVSPLTVVDTDVVRKDANEVIFVSHHPLHGTSQPQLLNLLHNEGVFKSTREMINFVAALCSIRQSSSNINSLPETINVADDYAERGAKLFAELGSVSTGTQHTPEDLIKKTNELRYYASVFKNIMIV